MSLCCLLFRVLPLLFCAHSTLAQNDASNETSTSTAGSQDKSLGGLPIVDFGYARYRATALNVSHRKRN